jgi:hypothetical protein
MSDSLRSDIKQYRAQVHDRLEGRDIAGQVGDLMNEVQDVIIDTLGGWDGMQLDDEESQELVYDIIVEEFIKIYFPGQQPKDVPQATSIEEI